MLDSQKLQTLMDDIVRSKWFFHGYIWIIKQFNTDVIEVTIEITKEVSLALRQDEEKQTSSHLAFEELDPDHNPIVDGL